jgi:hypothetical protein
MSLTKALEISIFAVAIAKLGRQGTDLALVKESQRLCTQGHWELQKTLWDSRLMYKDKTLRAYLALAMYEVLECPIETGEGYVIHHDGCSRLVQLRGAEAHTSGFDHYLFLAFRTHGVRLPSFPPLFFFNYCR